MSEPVLDIGPVEVLADRADVANFRSALQLPAEISLPPEYIPVTFPIRWLSLPEITDALMEFTNGGETVLLHAGQSFDYDQPLAVDRGYRLHVRATIGSGASDRLQVTGTVADQSGDRVLTMEATLVLLPNPGMEGVRP